MQLSFFMTLGLALMRSSYAAPASSSGVAVSKRTVDNLPPGDQFIVCPNYDYSRDKAEKAAQRGISTTPTTEPQPGGYPHKFGNNRKIEFPEHCKGKQLWEFPILPGSDKIYGGGDPGADRVVFIVYSDDPDTKPTQDGAYCGLMTHDGAPPNEFALCPQEE